MAHGGVVSIPEFKLKYSDVFSLRNLYLTMHEMLLEEGWLVMEGNKDHEDAEILYSENVYQRGIHRGGKEIWLWWRLQKFPEGKYSSYFKNFLDIDAHIVYLQNVEVVHQGKKMNVQKERLRCFSVPRIELDWQHKWDKHWFMRHMKPIYEKRIVHGEIDKMEKELWRDSYRVHAKLKQYLNLKNFVPVPEPFFARQFGYEE